jgi:hypothetical protein
MQQNCPQILIFKKKMIALKKMGWRNPEIQKIHSTSLYSLAESISGLLKRLQILTLELG